MAQFEVTIWSLVDPMKAVDEEHPETFRKEYTVTANSPKEAREVAVELHPFGVWESDIQEI